MPFLIAWGASRFVKIASEGSGTPPILPPGDILNLHVVGVTDAGSNRVNIQWGWDAGYYGTGVRVPAWRTQIEEVNPSGVPGGYGNELYVYRPTRTITVATDRDDRFRIRVWQVDNANRTNSSGHVTSDLVRAYVRSSYWGPTFTHDFEG